MSVRPRGRPVIDLLYSTGARLAEACAVTLEDVTDSHIILRNTKRRPGGLQAPGGALGPVLRAAVYELRQFPPGKRNTLVVACHHRVRDWMRELQRRTGICPRSQVPGDVRHPHAPAWGGHSDRAGADGGQEHPDDHALSRGHGRAARCCSCRPRVDAFGPRSAGHQAHRGAVWP